MTKSTWSEKDQTLIPGNNAQTGHDHLTLPGGKKPVELSTADLLRTLQAAGIAGVSANSGRDANMQLYAKFLAEIHKAAGDKAVADWLKAHP